MMKLFVPNEEPFANIRKSPCPICIIILSFQDLIYFMFCKLQIKSHYRVCRYLYLQGSGGPEDRRCRKSLADPGGLWSKVHRTFPNRWSAGGGPLMCLLKRNCIRSDTRSDPNLNETMGFCAKSRIVVAIGFLKKIPTNYTILVFLTIYVSFGCCLKLPVASTG